MVAAEIGRPRLCRQPDQNTEVHDKQAGEECEGPVPALPAPAQDAGRPHSPCDQEQRG